MSGKPFKPKYDAAYLLGYAVQGALEKYLENNYIYKGCLSCFHFKESEDKCIIANARPPAKVIVYGCPQWESKDEIPF